MLKLDTYYGFHELLLKHCLKNWKMVWNTYISFFDSLTEIQMIDTVLRITPSMAVQEDRYKWTYRRKEKHFVATTMHLLFFQMRC